MTKINVITAPDVLHNDTLSFLLVQPSPEIRSQFQNLVANFDIVTNCYLYDPEQTEQIDIPWLLNVSAMVNFTIVDLDNLGPEERNFSSYLISKPNTFYLTNDNTTLYNLISVNRIYNLDWLYEELKEE